MTSRKVDIVDAVKAGDAPMVHTLLCSGLDPNLFYSGQTALMHACEGGFTDIAEMLISNGAHVDVTDRYGRTALHFAARFGHMDCCKLLLSVNARDDICAELLGGETPLGFARAKNHLEIVKLLMYGQKDIRPAAATGADPYAKKKEEASVVFGDRSIAAGGASGATFAGRYAEGVDALPTPLPPPFAVQPSPIKDETRRLAPQPKYGY